MFIVNKKFLNSRVFYMYSEFTSYIFSLLCFVIMLFFREVNGNKYQYCTSFAQTWSSYLNYNRSLERELGKGLTFIKEVCHEFVTHIE